MRLVQFPRRERTGQRRAGSQRGIVKKPEKNHVIASVGNYKLTGDQGKKVPRE